jgi:transcriptional regulator with GAF, ATPase, and Fis domain
MVPLLSPGMWRTAGPAIFPGRGPAIREPSIDDNKGLTLTTHCCHTEGMATKPDIADYTETFDKVREVRAQAIEQYARVQELHAQRRGLLRTLIDAGFSQADVARELGVTRQAIQKMLG